jgi:hypothetical protein
MESGWHPEPIDLMIVMSVVVFYFMAAAIRYIFMKWTKWPFNTTIL